MRDAGGQQPVDALDLHQAQAAGADVGEALQVAQRRDVDAVLARDLEDRLVLARADVVVVDLQRVDACGRRRRCGAHACTSSPSGCIWQTPAGQRLLDDVGECTRRGSSAACSAPGWAPSGPARTGWCLAPRRTALRARRGRPSSARPSVMRLQQVVHLRRADAAGHALAARLAHAEFHEVRGHVHHAGRLVHDDHAARAHDRADLAERLVVDGHVEELRGDAAAGGAAGLHGLERSAVGDAAADVEDRSRAA